MGTAGSIQRQTGRRPQRPAARSRRVNASSPDRHGRTARESRRGAAHPSASRWSAEKAAERRAGTATTATMTAAGDLVFGGKNGLTIVSPGALPRDVSPLSLNFTQLEIITADNRKLFPATIQEHIEISALPKRVSFEFVALDFFGVAIQNLNVNVVLFFFKPRSITPKTYETGDRNTAFLLQMVGVGA